MCIRDSFKTALRIDTFSTRPLVDDFCTTTRHFTSNSTPQDDFSRQLRHVLNTSFRRRMRLDARTPGALSGTPHAPEWFRNEPHVCILLPSPNTPLSWIKHKMASCGKIVNKSTYCGRVVAQRCLEKDVLWRGIRRKRRVVLQKSSTRGRVEDVLICKVVELDVKWRVVVQNSSTSDESSCKNVNKMRT